MEFIQEIIYLIIKDGPYVIHCDKHKRIGNNWIVLYANGNNVTYFDSFGAEYIQKEIKKLIRNENVTADIYRIQTYNWITCKYCIFMLKGESLSYYTNLFIPNEYEKNDKKY